MMSATILICLTTSTYADAAEPSSNTTRATGRIGSFESASTVAAVFQALFSVTPQIRFVDVGAAACEPHAASESSAPRLTATHRIRGISHLDEQGVTARP